MPFVAIALGGDMNCYGVAKTFYEAYEIPTILIGKMPIFPTANSKLVERYYDPDLLEAEPLLEKLSAIEEKYPEKKKFLFGCNDDYVRHIIHNRTAIQEISDNFIIPMISEELFDQLDDKDSFYALCEKHGLPYPKSVIFDCTKDDPESFHIPFDYPIFIKPTSNVLYFPFQFEGKQKGYKVENHQHLMEIMGRIQRAKYPGNFVFQEYIEGDDDSMYIYAAYVNSKGKTVATVGSQILMHDRTPEMIGNYNAMTNARDDGLSDRLKAFLEEVGFTGICHFDIQYDVRRGDYVVYEINIRQGRSNYFMAAGGLNYAKLLVEDYIERKDTPYFVADKPFVVSNVPRQQLRKAVGAEKVDRVPEDRFYRFMLAPYDKNLKNSLQQKKIDKTIMENYWRYNQ